MASDRLSRRGFLIRGAAVGGAALLGGCDQLSQSPSFRDMLYTAEGATERVQRLALSSRSLAREYTEADLSKHFKANGSTSVADPAYQQAAQNGFADWRLDIGGLVERPVSLSLPELRKLPARLKSRGTTALRDGALSANGRARRWRRSCKAWG